MSPKEVADAFFRALVNKDASAWVSTLSRQLRGSCKDGGPFSANGWVEGSAKVRRRSKHLATGRRFLLLQRRVLGFGGLTGIRVYHA